MHRCFVDPAGWHSPILHLSPAEEHHLLHVLRVSTGESVELFDGHGRTGTGRLDVGGKRAADGCCLSINLLTEKRVQRVPRRLTLIQSLPRKRKMDLVVEKATELGVSVVIPVISEHVVAKLNERQRNERQERWQRIAVNAARQCRTNWLPEIMPVCNYTDIIACCTQYELLLIGSLSEDAADLHLALRGVEPRPRDIAIVIGPEGDLSRDEIQAMRGVGGVPVSFGPLVLRSETAALYGLSVLAYEFLNR